MQLLADAHEMPPRPLPWAPTGVGMGKRVHLVPFHRTATFPEAEPPTAMHSDGEIQDTAFSEAPGTEGSGCFLHAVPFQRSARGSLPPTPTPMHADRLVHEMP